MSDDVRRRVREDLAASRNYRALCPETLDRVSAWAADRYPKSREAIAAARGKLHQVCGAFLEDRALRRAASRLEGALSTGLLDACRDILTCHASTAERLPAIAQLYADIFSGMPPPTSILDLCCGLHPFGIPWMNLPAGVRYQASDIDTRLITLLGDFFAAHVPGATASAHDLLATTMPLQADMVFLMKALTTIEQQEHGSGRRVLERIHARSIVASFPTRTLGGRNVGMRETYRSTWTPIMQDLGWTIRELDGPGELVLILSRD